MITIFDQYGVEVMKDHELSSEELKALFELLHKLDPEHMDGAVGFNMLTPEEDGDNFYLWAIQNFFGIHTGNLVAKHFGDDISEMCQETECADFDKLPFVKIMKAMIEKFDIESTLKDTQIIVINP